MVKGAESGQTARLPLPWQAFIDEANASEVSSVEAEWLPFQPNKVVQENELPNQGLEVAMRGERCLGGWRWVCSGGWDILRIKGTTCVLWNAKRFLFRLKNLNQSKPSHLSSSLKSEERIPFFFGLGWNGLGPCLRVHNGLKGSSLKPKTTQGMFGVSCSASSRHIVPPQFKFMCCSSKTKQLYTYIKNILI